MGFEVLGYSPSSKNIPNMQTYAEGELAALAACNVLICTVPLTPKTRGLLSMPLFKQLKSPTYLINVARGAVQVEDDLLEALDKGYLSGAFDVFEKEPLPKESPLWTHPRVQITPHIASITNPDAGVGQILENVQAIETKTLFNTRLIFRKAID